MAQKCNIHNTDYRTQKKRFWVQKTKNQTIVWSGVTKCVIFEQLEIKFV